MESKPLHFIDTMSFLTVSSLLLASIYGSWAAPSDPNPGDVGPRIYEGVLASPGQFPFIVSLRERASNKHFCGGSILNPNWIITAAHCFDILPQTQHNTVVVAGSTTPQSSGVRTDVARIVNHPNYVDFTSFDISLLKLASPLRPSASIAPIKTGSLIGTQEAVRVLGWGAGSEYQLKYADLQTTPRCETNTPLICGETRNGQSCHGDSGGPLINSKKELVGIVSYGIIYDGSACNPTEPTRFTKVDAYGGFISQTLSRY